MNKFFVVPIFAALLLIIGIPTFAEYAPKKVDLVCMKNAVEKRENAIIAAKEKAFASMDTAFKARRDALKAAWDKIDAKERREAMNTAWKAFRASHKEARTQLRTDDKAAWKTFKIDSKACKVDSSLTNSDNAGEKIDASTL